MEGEVRRRLHGVVLLIRDEPLQILYKGFLSVMNYGI